MFTNILERIPNADTFDTISLKHDPDYDSVVAASDVVRDFIRRKQLILYGGTAVDYALRLKGDKIYPDESLVVPDLDFFCPDHLEAACELADVLAEKGYNCRVVRARFVKTMRVSIGNNRWVADISFIPQSIFVRLPYLLYDGMRVISPDFQRADFHSSLAFPYDDAPREVIFNRWSKDIKRFNKLIAAYPLGRDALPAASSAPLVKCRLPIDIFDSAIAHGFVAYGFFYNALDSPIRGALPEWVPAPSAPQLAADGTIEFDVPLGRIDVCVLRLPEGRQFAPYFTHTERTAIAKASVFLGRDISTRGDEREIIFHDNSARQCGYVSFSMDATRRIRAVSVQYMLKFFLCLHLRDILEGRQGNAVGLAYYLATLELIRASRDAQLFLPSVKVFGTKSDSFTDRITRRMTYERILGLDDTMPTEAPPRLYKPRKPPVHPTFDYEKSHIFIEDGRQLNAN